MKNPKLKSKKGSTGSQAVATTERTYSSQSAWLK